MDALAWVFARFWGYLALVLAIFGLVTHHFGFMVILILSLAAFGYFLVAAPVWCCAVTRTGQLCRDNSYGLLLGCHRRQHKWQRLKQTFTPAGGRAVLAAAKSASGLLALVGGVVAGVQVLIAAGGLVLH
jgi:hypothetical protein